MLTLTTLFPNAVQPRHGIFVANRLRRICDTGRVTCDVIAAVPCFPFAYRAFAHVPSKEPLHGFSVSHPRFLNVPKVGMRIQPELLARALLVELRERRDQGRAYDLVDAHYLYPDGVAATMVADALRLPLVISARGSDVNLIAEIPFARHRIAAAAERAQGLIAVSQALAARMCAIGLPSERIKVLRNGVDMDIFRREPQLGARQRLSIDTSGSWVLGVGNLVPEKGFDLLIEAVSHLDGVRLLLVGTGPMRDQLGRLAASRAPHRVEFRDNMTQRELCFAYSAADILALPSIREGWPNVLLEAIACGTPVVASAVGGVPEIVGPDGPGLLLSTRDPKDWAVGINRLLDKHLPAAVVRAHATQFGWDEIVAAQSEFYEEIVAQWKRPRSTGDLTRM